MDAEARRVKCCKARMNAGPDPQDCDAPFCGCNPAWQDAITMLQECGWGPVDALTTRHADQLAALKVTWEAQAQRLHEAERARDSWLEGEREMTVAYEAVSRLRAHTEQRVAALEEALDNMWGEGQVVRDAIMKHYGTCHPAALSPAPKEEQGPAPKEGR